MPFLRAYGGTGLTVSVPAVQGAMVLLNGSFAHPSNPGRRRPTEAIAGWCLCQARGEFDRIERALSPRA